jgi:hypothetical protein
MQRKPRFIVYELEKTESSSTIFDRVNDVFGVFASVGKANQLCIKLQKAHPENFYGIRELLKGGIWLKGA